MNEAVWTAIFRDVIRECGSSCADDRAAKIAAEMFQSVGALIDPTIAAKVVSERSAAWKAQQPEKAPVNVR